MANVPIKSITFPGLEDTYTFLQDDTTLSVSGAAADAKVTGDALSAINGDMTVLTPLHKANEFVWTLGKSISSTGTISIATGFALSDNIPVPPGSVIVNTTAGTGDSGKTTAFHVNEYTATGSFIKRTVVDTGASVTIDDTCASVRIAYGYPQNQGVTMTFEILIPYFSVKVVSRIEDREIENALKELNVTNILSALRGTNRTYNGVTFLWDEANGAVTVDGTASGLAFANLFTSQSKFPAGIVAGGMYQLLMSGATNSVIRFGYYNGSTAFGSRQYKANSIVVIPKTATGMYIRVELANGSTASMEHIRFALLSNEGKVVRLRPVNYVIYEIDMPADTTIEGDGNATTLTLDSGQSSTYAINAQRGCTIKDVKIIGAGGNDWSFDGTITSSHGIVVNTLGDTQDTRNRIQISGVEVSGFSGGGICLDSTGGISDNSVNIVNAYLHHNNVGLYIPQKSEYNRIANTLCARNYWGAIVNGGNNQFANCGFNSNTYGIKMDSTGITSPNDSHGSFVGCSFNHSGTAAIVLIGQQYGEVFSSCTIAYGGIEMTSCNGMVFANCNFLSDTPLTVTNGTLILFAGCVFLSATASPLTATGDPVVKFDGCYLRSGTPYDPTA